jgi:hypothetical protein
MARPTLPAALHSIAVQDYPLEVILVAACGAAHPAAPAAVGQHPLRFVASSHPMSRPVAANAGLDAVNGEWITFLDDDDLFLDGHVAGLMDAQLSAAEAGVIHSLALAVFRNGTVETFGSPQGLLHLYRRNSMHLSTAVIARSLLAAGCRFDAELEIHEDWDFFLQLAQHTSFHFVPQQTFRWNADAGESGAGGGTNRSDERFARFRDRVYAKWAQQYDQAAARALALLQSAGNALKNGDPGAAEVACREVLTLDSEDPWALNMLALIERAGGRLAAARSLQERAVQARPDDANLVYNLALVCRDLNDLPAASEHCGRALALAPESERVRALGVALGLLALDRH